MVDKRCIQAGLKLTTELPPSIRNHLRAGSEPGQHLLDEHLRDRAWLLVPRWHQNDVLAS
jgi:hypothetical protein